MIPPTPKGRFGRMFESTATPLITPADEAKLIALGQAMIDPHETEGRHTISAGYTYFGQFVDHDLTHDRTRLEDSSAEVSLISNYRTPHLDLEHLYCGGPQLSPELYEAGADPDLAQFRIDLTEEALPAPPPALPLAGSAHDVPRDSFHAAVTASEDDRSVENVILMQMHVLFMKFHNEAIRQLSATPPLITGIENLGEGSLFTRAQRLVRWHYQYLVHRDFLSKVIDSDIQRGVDRHGTSFVWPNNDFFMPVEFSMAAFRFGHSIVRNSYDLNCHTEHKTIAELSRQSRVPARLPETWVIEWGRYFPGWLLKSTGDLIPSMPINTSMASQLHALPPEMIRQFIPTALPTYSELPVRTLLRGARTQIPSGQEVADALVAKNRVTRVLTEEELTRETKDRSGPTLKQCGLAANTPLHYYILREAEILEKSRRLGPVGSQIVADVIEGALRDDSQSYLRCVGPAWSQPQWEFPNGARRLVDSMSDLVQLVDNYVLPTCPLKLRQRLLQDNPLLARLVGGVADLFA
jgi:hypothetical protein